MHLSIEEYIEKKYAKWNSTIITIFLKNNDIIEYYK